MPCGWEGNRRSGVALATRLRHRLQCFIRLRAHGLSKGDKHPIHTHRGVLQGEYDRKQGGVLREGAVIAPSHQQGVWGHCKLPQRGVGRRPGRKMFSCIPEAPDGLSWNLLGPSSGGWPSCPLPLRNAYAPLSVVCVCGRVGRSLSFGRFFVVFAVFDIVYI